jgi:hypothetical protein
LHGFNVCELVSLFTDAYKKSRDDPALGTQPQFKALFPSFRPKQFMLRLHTLMAIISRVYLQQVPETVLVNYLGDQAAVALLKQILDFDLLMSADKNVLVVGLRVVYKSDLFSNRITFSGCNPAGDRAYLVAPVTRPDEDPVLPDHPYTNMATFAHGDKGIAAMIERQ